MSQPHSRELTDREEDILKTIITLHIAHGKPVGSRILSKRHREKLSPASIRNIMADLEEAGYLMHPHTSAGRIPTDKGYRFYVDNLIEKDNLNKSEQESISEDIFKTDSHDNVLMRISHTVSQLTDNIGFVISPSLGQNSLKHIELIALSENRILVVLVARSGLVQNRIIRMAEPFSQSELDQTARYVNENYAGYSLLAIRNSVLQKMSEEKALYDRLLKNVILLCDRGLIDEVSGQDVDIYVDGASNLINKPEFADTVRMRSLFRTFEEKSKLVKILNECINAKPGDGVRIIIGSENTNPGMQDYALISSPLIQQDQSLGSVGILGPIRMEYARAISVVDYVAKLYGRILIAN
ncbi:MAG: heat-inducible transcriptional repressor HrcA [Acidobacteriota bacterium]